MTDKSIARQINEISLSLISGLVILALLAVVGTIMVRSIFVEYRGTSSATLQANDIFEDIFQARMAALQWRIEKTPEHVEEFLANIEEINAVEENPDAGNSAELSALKSDIAAYAASFAEGRDAQAQFDAADEKLSTLGRDARQMLSEIIESAYRDGDPAASYLAAQAQESLMLGRYYTRAFGASEKQADYDRASAEVQAAATGITALLGSCKTPSGDNSQHRRRIR